MIPVRANWVRKHADDHGMASIVVVSVLVVLITLVTVGFATIMNRASRNSLNNQLSTAAGYAAQSGINDAINYLNAHPSTAASNCTDLANTAPFTDSNLSGDGKTAYSCVLVNPNPGSLTYQAIPSGSSEVIKATTAAQAQQFMFSWKLAAAGATGTQPASVSGGLPDETVWNANHYTPLLRVTLYPIPSDGSLSTTQSASKTFYFYPTSAGGAVTKFNYSSMADGSLVEANCGAALSENGYASDSFDCHAGINGLNSAMPNLSYFYLRITPIYSQADIIVQAKDNGGNSDAFQNTQVAIDVTGRSGPAVKRLEARVSNSAGPSDNVYPEYALRSANAICKRLNVQSSTGPITIESSYCNLSAPCIPFPSPLCPAPSVTLTANPASIISGDSSTLTWKSIYTKSCYGSSSPDDPSWDGSKTANPTPPPGAIPSGDSQAVHPTQTTTYTITCPGTFDSSASDSATVTLRPSSPPIVARFYVGTLYDQHPNCRYTYLSRGKAKSAFPDREYWCGGCKVKDALTAVFFSLAVYPNIPDGGDASSADCEQSWDFTNPSSLSYYPFTYKNIDNPQSQNVTPSSFYPRNCHGHSGAGNTLSSDCNRSLSTEFEHAQNASCADSSHQLTTCWGWYSVSGGYGDVDCHVTYYLDANHNDLTSGNYIWASTWHDSGYANSTEDIDNQVGDGTTWDSRGNSVPVTYDLHKASSPDSRKSFYHLHLGWGSDASGALAPPQGTGGNGSAYYSPYLHSSYFNLHCTDKASTAGGTADGTLDINNIPFDTNSGIVSSTPVPL